MAIVYIPKYQEYVGLSTDDKTGITTEGAIIYYSNTKKRQILHGGAWSDYVVNTDAILETGDIEIGAVEIKNATDDTRATVGTNGLYTEIQNPSNNPARIRGNGSCPMSSYTRPNNQTPYSIGDVCGTDAASNLSFTNVSNITGGDIIISGASLEIGANAIPAGMSGFRLHLYDAEPTAITDNLAFNLPSGDRAKYLGYIEFSTPVDLGDTLWSQVDNVNMKRKLATASTNLYGILETRGAYTPTAQCVKNVTLHVLEV